LLELVPIAIVESPAKATVEPMLMALLAAVLPMLIAPRDPTWSTIAPPALVALLVPPLIVVALVATPVPLIVTAFAPVPPVPIVIVWAEVLPVLPMSIWPVLAVPPILIVPPVLLVPMLIAVLPWIEVVVEPVLPTVTVAALALPSKTLPNPAESIVTALVVPAVMPTPPVPCMLSTPEVRVISVVFVPPKLMPVVVVPPKLMPVVIMPARVTPVVNVPPTPLDRVTPLVMVPVVPLVIARPFVVVPVELVTLSPLVVVPATPLLTSKPFVLVLALLMATVTPSAAPVCTTTSAVAAVPVFVPLTVRALMPVVTG
jgi:hypothetical protein